MIRKVFVFLHRWVGLALALFLIIEGLTGSLLAFRGDLTRFFDPALAGAPPIPGAPKLDLATLIERAKALEPRASYGYRLPIADDTAIMKMDPRIDPATGKPYDLGFTYLALDPWTGTELKRLQHGMYTHGFLTNVMPFVYDLHKTLILNHAGEWILSILALLWTIDCFVGLYLTLPITLEKFWSRWTPAWLVKWRGSFYRVNFDLHRAGGLWLWPLLLIFAWSSVRLEPYTGAYDLVMEALLGPREYHMPSTPTVEGAPKLDWHAALARGETLLAEQGALHGFKPGEAQQLNYDSGSRRYWYRAQSDRFFPEDTSASIYFDADSGAYQSSWGTYSDGKFMTVENWLLALHMVNDPVDYLPYRIFVVFVGLIITALSVTGVYIWWKKRKARIHAKSHAASGTALHTSQMRRPASASTR
ncbi:PepSY-associated TM helix domain-containing protein [Rhodoblastus sp.]|uniref:PepSY-associated TM helix domain-containing protein n=1 Tax=Rhodoblastus sp. TaxID=1962975 RepID=UPI003F9C5186